MQLKRLGSFPAEKASINSLRCAVFAYYVATAECGICRRVEAYLARRFGIGLFEAFHSGTEGSSIANHIMDLLLPMGEGYVLRNFVIVVSVERARVDSIIHRSNNTF